MRVVYCLDSINRIGGIQRVTVTKANALAGIPGNEVWILIADNSGKRVYEVSPKVHVIDLDINYYSDDWKSRWYVLKGFIVKRRLHRSRLKQELARIKPDVVVSVGQSEKHFLPGIKGPWARVREIHFPKNYRWLAADSLFDRILAVGGDIYDYRFRIHRYDRIVVLTNEDRERNWKFGNKVVVIPNPCEVRDAGVSALEDKRVIAAGRLTSHKNFSSLIRAFRKVADKHPDWRLDIFGEGDEREPLQKHISELSLAGNVSLKGSAGDIIKEMKASSVLALSSRFEGFGLVLIEAMSVGVPVVAYACPCGPKDIVTEGVDGFLVPFGDEDSMAGKLCELIEDERKRRSMGMAALSKAARYNVGEIMRMWMSLFGELAVND